MDYITLIKKFWKFNEKQDLNYSIVSFYLLLLEEWDNNSNQDFRISDVIISKKLQMRRMSIPVIKQKLLQLGLIQYKTKNGSPCLYKIITDYNIDLFLESSSPTKPNAEDKGKPLEIPKVEIPKTTTEPPKVETPLQKETEIPKVEVPIHKEPQKELPKGIPTLEEFLAYAKTIEIYQPELDFQIKTKYEKWLDDGWKTGFGKPIKNWQIVLKSAMSYMNKSNTFQGNIPQIKAPKMTYNE